MTLIPSLTFTDYEWFPWSIRNGCGMPAGNPYPSGHLVPSSFWWACMCSDCWDQFPESTPTNDHTELDLHRIKRGFPWSICDGCGMPAGSAYPSGHLVLSPILGLANATIVETKFLELAMSLLDFSPRIPLGTFSILLGYQTVWDILFRLPSICRYEWVSFSLHTFGLQGSVNVHCGALFLVPQWQCISSFAFYIRKFIKGVWFYLKFIWICKMWKII